MLLMIDNYDSFTYNVVQYLAELGADVQVYRNDEITIEQIEVLKPERLVISPGPCTPNEAGISMDAIRHFAGGERSPVAASGGPIVRDPHGPIAEPPCHVMLVKRILAEVEVVLRCDEM